MALRVTSILRIRARVAVFGGFAGGDEAAILIAERQLAAGGGASGHLESGADRGAAAGDSAAAVAVERSEPDQGGNGASGEPAELGQQRHQAGGGTLLYASERAAAWQPQAALQS
jgi:hypothetical protein